MTFYSVVNFLKNFAYIATPILLGLIIWTVVKFKGLKQTPGVSDIANTVVPPEPVQTSALQARWNEVRDHINSTREGEWKFAVIEADKLVDDILKSAGFPGETTGERLMNIEAGQLSTLQGLWDAHKTRNRLAHDSNYFLRYAEAKRAIELFEQTLKELGAL